MAWRHKCQGWLVATSHARLASPLLFAARSCRYCSINSANDKITQGRWFFLVVVIIQVRVCVRVC